MSLYTKLFGENEEAPVLLGMIGLNKEFFGRFRDIELIEKGSKIRVTTRLGGGNRKDYEEIWEDIRSKEMYLVDYDDNFDNTYAYIEFDIIEKYKETAKKMFQKEPLTVHEKFEKEIAEANIPGSPAAKRQEKIAKEIMRAIEEGNHFIGL